MNMSSDPTIAALQFIAIFLSVVVGLILEAGILYGIYFLLTIPLRRDERARIFLDILQLGLKDGQTPEAAIINASTSNDKSFGARFHILAAH